MSVPAAGLPSGLTTIPSTADPVSPRGAAVSDSSICRFFSFLSGLAGGGVCPGGGTVCPTITKDPSSVNVTNEAGKMRRKKVLDMCSSLHRVVGYLPPLINLMRYHMVQKQESWHKEVKEHS